MITLCHAPRTRSVRILWFLEELATFYHIDYQVEQVEFVPPANGFFTQNTPTGKIPYLSDGNSGVSESGAIIQYLLEKYDIHHRFSPPVDSENRAAFLQWFHYAEGTLSIPLSVLLWHGVYKQDADQLPTVIADAKDRAERSLTAVENAMAENSYLLGDTFSAADVMVSFTLWNARQLGVLGQQFANLHIYLNKLETRPALQKALAI